MAPWEQSQEEPSPQTQGGGPIWTFTFLRPEGLPEALLLGGVGVRERLLSWGWESDLQGGGLSRKHPENDGKL